MLDDKKLNTIVDAVYKELQDNGDRDVKNLSKETVCYHLKQILRD